jgi:hypothetical protein
MNGSSVKPQGLSRQLAQIVGAVRALALGAEQYPEGPPAKASATSGTGTSRSRPERIITGRLHDDSCSPRFRVVGVRRDASGLP